MSKRVYFKVVGTEDRKSYVRQPFSVKYAEQKWVKPRIKNSSLMVFSDMKFAKCCVFDSSKVYKIVKCHIKRAKNQPKRILELDRLELKSLRKYWKMVQEKHPDTRDRNLPMCIGKLNLKFAPCGTVFADEVFCLE